MGIFHSKVVEAYRSVHVEFDGRRNRSILPTLLFATLIGGAGAAVYYHYEAVKKIFRRREEGGWKFYRGHTSSGDNLGQHVVRVADVRDECARVTSIAAEADRRVGVHAFDAAGRMYGHTENYPLLTGSIGNLLDGVFCRDAMVPPGWIAFPNTSLRDKGVKTLHRLSDVFCMAQQAAEQGMFMFDTSGSTCQERLISSLTYIKKSDRVTYVKYADRR
ncbi:hypothetical protein VaNZ11_001243 [Volvox africanus]|uniref:Uncharacterized protein n=1 Tax=Volvox africanus TaxID=51714 RepID=A0ABQ5RPZ3_9CHLO|nr:hypothetical protein VaNZ11_001243 [Volvox africanus]